MISISSITAPDEHSLFSLLSLLAVQLSRIAQVCSRPGHLGLQNKLGAVHGTTLATGAILSLFVIM